MRETIIIQYQGQENWHYNDCGWIANNINDCFCPADLKPEGYPIPKDFKIEKPSFGKDCPCGKPTRCFCHTDGGHAVCCEECKNYCKPVSSQSEPKSACCEKCSRHDNFCVPSCYPKHCHFAGCVCHKHLHKCTGTGSCGRCNPNIQGYTGGGGIGYGDSSGGYGSSGLSNNQSIPESEEERIWGSPTRKIDCSSQKTIEQIEHGNASQSTKSLDWIADFDNTDFYREEWKDTLKELKSFMAEKIEEARKKAKNELNESMNEYIKGIETDAREQGRQEERAN